jgi:sodium/proline symporter
MLIALSLSAAVLLVLAWRAGRTARNTEDFFLAGRKMHSGLLALSQVSNALPLWLLLGVAAAAFAWGFAAVWILLTALVGYAFGWYFVAPRLRDWSQAQDHLTLPQLLTGDTGKRLRGRIVLSAVVILFMAFLLGMSAYLPLLGEMVASVLPVSARTGVLVGISLATLCALLGGYKGACVNDGVRAIVILVIAISVAVLALLAAGGWSPVWLQLTDLPVDVGLWTGEQAAILAVTFALGTLMLGIVPFGQPQVVSQFMVSTDAMQLQAARRTALLWVLLVLAAMLVCGWAARLLLPSATALQSVFPELLRQSLPEWLAAASMATLLVCAFSALDGVLLVMAAAVSVDIKAERVHLSLDWPKPAVVLAGALLAAVALTVPEPSFERLLLSWTLLGSAFGPLLLVRLTGKRVRPGATMGSMWAGFVLTLLLHLLPNAPGDFLERALPFVAALGIALTGGERRRDPDRADRSQQGAAPLPGPTSEPAVDR